MRLTKKKAIEESIELWEWLAETGKEKEDWPEWNEDENILNDCFFCEYSYRRSGALGCKYCPLGRDCYDTAFGKWDKARTRPTKKKYARLFLAELKELKEE